MSVCRGVAARPDFYDAIFRRSTALPPEHRVDVRQVGQRDVGGKSVRGTGEVQLPAVLVYLVMLQSAKRLVGGKYHFTAVLPIAMIMLLLVRVRATVVAAALLEESVRYALLRLMFLQMFPDFPGIFQGRSAAVQSAMMVFSARVTGAIRGGRYQIGQFGGGELLRWLMLLLIEINGTPAGRDGRGRSGEIHREVARALERILQGVVRRRTSALVRALAVQT